jgi:hypothetical protein
VIAVHVLLHMGMVDKKIRINGVSCIKAWVVIKLPFLEVHDTIRLQNENL